MNGNYLFDTNAVIYYLQGLPSWVRFIDDTSMTKRSASVITRMELLSYPGIEANEQNNIQRFLSELIVMPIDSDIENMAIAIRRTARLKLPDAIIAATAVTLNAILLTGDQHISELDWPGLQTVTPT